MIRFPKEFFIGSYLRGYAIDSDVTVTVRTPPTGGRKITYAIEDEAA